MSIESQGSQTRFASGLKVQFSKHSKNSVRVCPEIEIRDDASRPRGAESPTTISLRYDTTVHGGSVTLEELEASLPNGLHDAELLTLQVDYARYEAVIDVNVDVSVGEAEDIYRPARLMFSGIQFVAIDPPTVRPRNVGLSIIGAGAGQPSTAPTSIPEIPSDCFLCWIFVVNWNSFIRIAARNVAHQWLGDL